MHDKQKTQIVYEAARLLATRQETNVHSAKLRAARKLFRTRIKSANMPSDREIHDEVRRLEPAAYSARESTDFATTAAGEPAPHETPDEHTVDSENHADESTQASDDELFVAYKALLLPLESVTPNLRTHPEGDVLYHSLQVFELVRAERPWDEELLLAALLHDVGKAFDPHDHVNSGLRILDGFISDRTAWFIEHHVVARGLLDGSIGARARRRLVESGDFEEIELLARADRDGCVPGETVCDLDEALTFIREIDNA